jgi:hypothetical protein
VRVCWSCCVLCGMFIVTLHDTPLFASLLSRLAPPEPKEASVLTIDADTVSVVRAYMREVRQCALMMMCDLCAAAITRVACGRCRH